MTFGIISHSPLDSSSYSTTQNDHKMHEPEPALHELRGTRFNEIIESLPGKFYGLGGVVDIIVIYDDPYEDIIKILQQKREIPETLSRIANQVTKLDLKCLEPLLPKSDPTENASAENASVEETSSIAYSASYVISNIMPKMFSIFKNVESLTVPNSIGKAAITIDLENDIDDISKMQNLLHLDLSFCSDITDDDLEIFPKLLFKNLQSLELSNCHKITNIGLAHISQLKNLRYLNIAYCKLITDTGIAILTNLEKLQHLVVNEKATSGDVHKNHIFNIKSLHKLVIYGKIKSDKKLTLSGRELNESDIAHFTELMLGIRSIQIREELDYIADIDVPLEDFKKPLNTLFKSVKCAVVDNYHKTEITV